MYLVFIYFIYIYMNLLAFVRTTWDFLNSITPGGSGNIYFTSFHHPPVAICPAQYRFYFQTIIYIITSRIHGHTYKYIPVGSYTHTLFTNTFLFHELQREWVNKIYKNWCCEDLFSGWPTIKNTSIRSSRVCIYIKLNSKSL